MRKSLKKRLAGLVTAVLWLAAFDAMTTAALGSLTKGPEVNASGNTTGVYSETAIAINPLDHATMLVASNHIGGGGSMPVSISTDRGAHFTRTDIPRTVAGVTYSSAAAPSLAYDGFGNAYFAYMVAQGTLGETYHPVVAVRKAGESHWESPFLVSGTQGDDDKPYLAADARKSGPFAGRVYLAWDRNAEDGSQAILLARADGAEEWGPAVRVDDSATSSGSVIYAMPAVGPNGEVYVVWNDYGQANGGSLRFDRSFDGGDTFGKDVLVTDLRLNLQPDPATPGSVYSIPAQATRGIAACPSVGVDVSSGPRRGWIYVCYGDRASGKVHEDVDVFVRHSTDGGASWSAPVEVNDDTAAGSQFLPAMSVDPVDGSLNVCWYDCRNDPANVKADVYYARSTDGGVTFEPNVRVTSVASDESQGVADPLNQFGDYLGIAAIGGQVAAAWTDARNVYNQAHFNQAYAMTMIQPAMSPSHLAQAAANMSLPAGVSLGRRSITLSAALTGPAAALSAEWEVKSVDTPFDGSGTAMSSNLAYSGAQVLTTLTLTGLANGAYHWRVRGDRTDGLAPPGEWTPFSDGTDFSIGVPAYLVSDVARALKIAAGIVAASVFDSARLDVIPPDGRSIITVADAVRIARAVFGLSPLP